MDLGLLGGTAGAQPEGIIAQAEAVSGPTLIAAAGAGIAAIGEAGGVSITIALSPTAYAAQLTSTDDQGRLMHPDGLPDLLGLNIVQVPGLADPLLYDSAPLLPGPGPRHQRDPPRRLGARRDHPERLGPRKRRGASRRQGLRKLDVGDGSTASAARHGQQPVVKVKGS